MDLYEIYNKTRLIRRRRPRNPGMSRDTVNRRPTLRSLIGTSPIKEEILWRPKATPPSSIFTPGDREDT